MSPASAQSLRNVSIRDASTLGGQSGVEPSAAISSCSAANGKAAAEDVPRIRRDAAARAATTRAISATDFAGSGTKKMTSAITAASKAASA